MKINFLALKLEPKAYTPSLMLALEDQLVPYSLLRMCLEAYVPPEADPSNDPLLSPIYLSNEVRITFIISLNLHLDIKRTSSGQNCRRR